MPRALPKAPRTLSGNSLTEVSSAVAWVLSIRAASHAAHQCRAAPPAAVGFRPCEEPHLELAVTPAP